MINKEGGIETMDLNKLKEIQAVVFDMDGLMFDSERYVQKSWDIAGERLGYGPLGHNIVNTLGTNLTKMIFHLINFWMDTEMHIMNWLKTACQPRKVFMRF